MVKFYIMSIFEPSSLDKNFIWTDMRSFYLSGSLHEAYISFRGPFLACTAAPGIFAVILGDPVWSLQEFHGNTIECRLMRKLIWQRSAKKEIFLPWCNRSQASSSGDEVGRWIS
jgi:hypothetical protein